MNGILQDIKIYYKNGGGFQKIIFWNICISIVLFILQAFYNEGYEFIKSWFALSSFGNTSLLKPWTYITYSFLHAGFFHLISNLIMLHFSGRLFTTYFKEIQFNTVYFGGIIFAGIIYIIASKLLGMENFIVGASAGVIAVLFAVVTYNPFYEIKLLLVGNIKLWMIGLFLILFFIIQIPTSNLGGHIAHLAGILFGFLYTKFLLKGKDLAAIPTIIFSIFSSRKNKQQKLKNTPFKKVYQNKAQIEISVNEKSHPTKNDKQQRIDDILDKISVSGYDSLAADEKDFLFRAGKE